MTRRWLLAGAADDPSPPPALPERILRARGLSCPHELARFLSPTLHDLHPPWLLPGVPEAAHVLVDAVRAGRRIAIYGDYDVDGITATAILYHTIRKVQPEHPVRSYVPHRLEEGYGLNESALTTLRDEGCDVVITVDCGITATDAAAHARRIGLDLIITDHHELPAEGPLPEALLVHPRLPGSVYPCPDLCGAGVAFKLAVQFLRTFHGFRSDPDLRLPRDLAQFMVNLLPLVALGTIADVAPLLGENRVLVREGLRRIPYYTEPGLHALIAASGLMPEDGGVAVIDCERVGFQLAPRLNACGRLGHAAEAVELLTTATPAQAKTIATFLDQRNQERQKQGQRIFIEACEQAERDGLTGPDQRIIVLAQDDWHPGIVGIICSKLVDRYGRPAILLCGDDLAPDILRGSGRSINGFSLHAALAACAQHLERYGGHEMAAGLALKRTALKDFQEAMLAYAHERITPQDMIPSVHVDCDAQLHELDLRTVRQLREMAPFGRGNRAPVVRLPNMLLEEVRYLGKESKHLALRLRSERGPILRGTWWNQGELGEELKRGMRLDVVAEPKINSFRNQHSVELDIRDVRPANQPLTDELHEGPEPTRAAMPTLDVL